MKISHRPAGFFLALLVVSACCHTAVEANEEEDEAIQFLEDLEPKYSRKCNEQETIDWDFETNITKENEDRSVDASAEFAAFQAAVQKQILERFPHWQNFQNQTLRREFYYLSRRGPANMKPELIKEQSKLGAEMESAYGSTKVCEYRSSSDTKSCRQFNLDPEITEILMNSHDFDKLAYYWDAWHDAMAKAVPLPKYRRYMELDNEYARANNYSNMAEMWASTYEDGSPNFSLSKFKDSVLNLWKQIRPYYEILHAYVRMKLREQAEYTEKLKQYEPYLPANIMGDMWAQDWSALENFTKPFKDVPSFDATEAMKRAHYTPKIMFEKADKFFENLGLPPMTKTFWEKSMIVRPKGREVVCHASSHDFCWGKGNMDFRIKMCTKVDQDDFYTIHHEMGHIEYFMAYTDQPYIFRDGANPGFHEAIGDTIALSVSTPRHLQCKLGFDVGVPTDCNNRKASTAVTPEDINFLYYVALQKLPLYPFALTTDMYRWGIYEGSTPESEFNSQWWDLRRQNQGIVPPNPRNVSAGLDAAAKYHVAAGYEYMRYFISHVLQFQFYEAMCILAGEYNPDDPHSRPLHQCDYAGSKTAGKALGDMMALGLSKPWPEALKVLTGTESMRVEPVLRYFKPLIEHLKDELVKRGETIGFHGQAESE